MFGYSFGWGPLPVLISMELFPVSSRGNAVSAAIAVNWIFAFIITELFEITGNLINPAIVFVIFSICCLISMVYVHKYLPETSDESNGSTLDTISSLSYKSQLSA